MQMKTQPKNLRKKKQIATQKNIESKCVLRLNVVHCVNAWFRHFSLSIESNLLGRDAGKFWRIADCAHKNIMRSELEIDIERLLSYIRSECD